MCAGIELSGAYQIAYVLQEDKIQIFVADPFQTLPGHLGIQVTHAAGVQLYGWDAGFAGDGLRIHIAVNVRLHDAHFQRCSAAVRILQVPDRADERRGLARAR